MILSQIWGFLEFEPLDFSDFAYYHRQARYLAGTGGPVAEKKIRLRFGPFRPKFGSKSVFC